MIYLQYSCLFSQDFNRNKVRWSGCQVCIFVEIESARRSCYAVPSVTVVHIQSSWAGVKAMVREMMKVSVSQVRLSKSPAALHHARARRTVTVVGQLHQVRQQAVVRQLVLPVEGIWEENKHDLLITGLTGCGNVHTVSKPKKWHLKNIYMYIFRVFNLNN